MTSRLLPILLLLALLLAPTSAAQRVDSLPSGAQTPCFDLHLRGPDGAPPAVGNGCPEGANAITFDGLLEAGQAEARVLLEVHPLFLMTTNMAAPQIVNGAHVVMRVAM